MRGNSLFRNGVFASLTALCASMAVAADGFKQDRFAIGMWVVPQTSENLPARYEEMAGANFNLVIGTAGTNAAGQLALCEKLGLRAIVEPGAAPNDLPESPACWGYILRDEPNVSDFPALAGQVAEIRAKRPGKFGYVNLFPNYATPEQLGAPTYREHVTKFVDMVKPEVLSMDHYPVMRPESDGREAYCENLETMRRDSLRAGIPFWNFFHSMPFGNHIDPTEAQIRWQIYASIAWGSKGVLYFCYWTPGKGAGGAGEFPKGGAIITAEGLRTRHYEEARRINAELKNLGPTLMKLTSTGVVRINTAKETPGLRQTPLRKLSHVAGDPAAGLIVGAFTHADGRRAVLLLNHNHAYTAWPNVEFDADLAQVREVDKASGREVPVIDDSPELKGLQLSLGAGDARLFLLP